MASFAGSVPLDDKVIKINPIDAESGELALATPNAVSGLRNGNKTHGVVLAVTTSGCRIFKPATSKGAHKTWDDFLCDSASVVKSEGRGYSLVGLFGDGNARAFSIPGLKEIGCSAINNMVDMRRLSDSTVCSNGTTLVWTGPSEIGLFSVWGSGISLYENPLYTSCCFKDRCVTDCLYRKRSDDQLFNIQAVIPPRPTITNIQWISGTQYITPADMDILSMNSALFCPFSSGLKLYADDILPVGGPDRPLSKRMQEQMRLDDQERRRTAREERSASSQPAQGSDEGYFSYMQRQLQERTERLGTAGDQMERLEESSSGWARDVNKFVSNQKRKAVLGGKL